MQGAVEIATGCHFSVRNTGSRQGLSIVPLIYGTRKKSPVWIRLRNSKSKTRSAREAIPCVRENFNPSRLYRFPQRLYVTERSVREEKGARAATFLHTYARSRFASKLEGIAEFTLFNMLCTRRRRSSWIYVRFRVRGSSDGKKREKKESKGSKANAWTTTCINARETRVVSFSKSYAVVILS